MHNKSVIEMLELEVQVMGGTDRIYPVVVYDKERAMLVDTGYPGLGTRLMDALAGLGMSADQLDAIMITHQDLDHIGSLPELLALKEKGITVLAHELERPYIEGQRMLLKHTPEALAAAESMLPPDLPAQWREAFLRVLKHPPHAPVNTLVADGDELEGGLCVIHTPGHSPGHISLYHRPSRTLIAGDALTTAGGVLFGPDPTATPDMETALDSLRKLADYDIDSVICYHGGWYRGEANKRIAALAKAKPHC